MYEVCRIERGYRMLCCRIIFQDGGALAQGLGDFSLPDTLDCGQCFRWNPAPEEENTYQGIALGHPLKITCQGEGEFFFHNTTEEEFYRLWAPYFDLYQDYNTVKRQLCQDPVLGEAAQYAPGIRVLRQDGWEALCSFIISQNNNIKRIKGIVERLCQCFGTPLEGGGYAFPTAQQMAGLTVEDLAPLRCGFRAKYLIDAAQKVAQGTVDLGTLGELPYQEAKEYLMQIKGVGPKVADCALLYGFYRLEAFPMDVWMKRAMAQLFPQGLPECAKEYGGIAQQYIFHYARTSGCLGEGK